MGREKIEREGWGKGKREEEIKRKKGEGVIK